MKENTENGHNSAEAKSALKLMKRKIEKESKKLERCDKGEISSLTML